MKKWLAYLILGALLVGGLVISALYSPIWYDDAGHFLVAREVARGNGMCYPLEAGGSNCVKDSPFITMGPIQAYPVGFWLRFLGGSMLMGRILMVLVSLGAAFALFQLGKTLTSSSKALIAVGIMAVNIQFITYGAEILGEVPMMGLILGGIACILRWEEGRSWHWAGAGIGLWCMAVGIKEYAIFPISLSLAVWFLIHLITKDRPLKVLLIALSFAFKVVVTLFVLHWGFDGLVNFMTERQSYGSEFLAFNLGISLKYLLFKPLFWIGTVAMVVKWRVKRRREETLTLSVQMAWLVFYLLSAGYDRFGFLLLFLPAIYVAEFVPYLWKEAGRKMKYAWLRRGMLVLIGLLVFSQQTFLIFGGRILHPEQVNAIEKAATARIVQGNYTSILTVEQQMALFLDDVGKQWRLVSIVPSQARMLEKPVPELWLRSGEVFLAGPYAFTEYKNCIDWAELQVVDSVIVGEEKWVIYQNKFIYEPLPNL